jgi:hypothetical protein
MAQAGITKRRKQKKTPACPQCGSSKFVPVLYGSPTPEMREAVRRGRAVLADCEEWEGLPEWHCAACGCDWRGGWTRFKKSQNR